MSALRPPLAGEIDRVARTRFRLDRVELFAVAGEHVGEFAFGRRTAGGRTHDRETGLVERVDEFPLAAVALRLRHTGLSTAGGNKRTEGAVKVFARRQRERKGRDDHRQIEKASVVGSAPSRS